ncbi:adenosine kinase [Babesia caballi]|uniref:Adenosine kinase n=1 Tax=Babesia caballi TaxID=5871 RepID=A0AAV4M3A2_BABCB|nr:adenosine kinase [Babesia caballi]
MNVVSLFSVAVALWASVISVALSKIATGDEVVERGPASLFFACNGLAAMLARVDQSVIDSLNFTKGESNGVTPETFKALGERVNVEFRSHGSSSANSARAYCYLGGKASFFTVLGDDEHADLFDSYIGSHGVDMMTIRRPGTFTSQIYTLITPDAERSMYLLWGASHTIKPGDLSASVMDNYDYYVVNGFMFATPGHVEFSHKMIEAALSRGKQLILLLANRVCIRKWSDLLKPIAAKSAYISGNLEEYSMLYGLEEPEKLFTMFEELTDGEKPQHKAVIITMGGDGAMVMFQGQRYFVPPTGVNVIDTTGAGDIFAGSILYGLLNGLSVKKSGELARAMVGDILPRVGTKFSDGLAAKIVDIKASA